MIKSDKYGLFALATLLVAAPSMTSANYAAAPSTIEGTWVGDFGSGPWTFEFKNTGSGWSGRYRHPKFNGWNPLQKLSASKAAAKFSIDANSKVEFDFRLKASDAMKATVTFGATKEPKQDELEVPFELRRVPK